MPQVSLMPLQDLNVELATAFVRTFASFRCVCGKQYELLTMPVSALSLTPYPPRPPPSPCPPSLHHPFCPPPSPPSIKCPFTPRLASPPSAPPPISDSMVAGKK